MANEPIKAYRHVLLTQRGNTKLYAPGGGRKVVRIREKDRHAHSNKLLEQIQNITNIEIERKAQRERFINFSQPGICIAFESTPGFELLFEKLEFLKDGIVLLSVKEREGRTEAICYVPEGKLQVFVKRIQDYASKDTKWNRPAYADLINSIENIKAAALKEFWTDENPMPEGINAIWWEVWIRTDEPAHTFNLLQEASVGLEIQIANEYLTFPERMVIQVFATQTLLTKSIEILNLVSEVRMGNREPKARLAPDSEESDQLLQKILSQLNVSENSNVGIAILDTGVNRLHPLLEPILAADDMHASDDDWPTSDHHGHGTTMAGLAAFGDLYNHADQKIDIPFKLESVKILPPFGRNSPHLYGKKTADGVYKCETQAPDRKRIYSKSITSSLHKKGEPSSYSAKIDDLASGANDNKRRLFVISAGNTDAGLWHLAPTSNLTDSIEEPAQAWNALTVGAFTNLVELPNIPEYLGWGIVAPKGALSPYSCTSEQWHNSGWPFKPDVVWEGGNCAVNPDTGTAEDHDSLSLLTTNWQPTNRLFAVSCMTSAATAQVAGLAGRVQSSYPDLWPETIRAIIVHSANWTQAMTSRFPLTSKSNKETLLRTCGYGVPNEKMALQSLSNNVVLLVQDDFQPFQIIKGNGRTKQLQIHNLPWPKSVLESLGEIEIKMKVTLSYFVEPNPAQRGWQSKFRYQSFGLRFDLRRKDESERGFEKRVTKLASEDETLQLDPIQDSGWRLGFQLRNKGSIHSDTWTGSAVALASRDRVAVYPVLGWWRERLNLGRCERRARYSLIISIESPNTDVNLYEKIQLQLGVPLENVVEI